MTFYRKNEILFEPSKAPVIPNLELVHNLKTKINFLGIREITFIAL